mmetsp:Transcript_133153/g.259237  ORF Transcript_133153/g.259237 Transcript_133153/m.259237 type:complete len:258 (+) Transcript_133153:64-837(+)|eukprot:CAMPEP_0172662970 /NCGR_PEP_ID=MMETSP1074-20121228/5644_1 /TAXON_ID=2916 /ORGANISM="Ceratium fusus, Strain PA161109" /LENGTH=257 /DNA_ID=CAMNT_0013478911 /DNA_START=64 /DNA_END=837 /DNA_ORIENTATION=+
MGQIACSSLETCESEVHEPVYLHLYNLGTSGHGSLLNRFLKNMGTGVYHCGVEVFCREWSFADTESGQGHGVFECPPRRCTGHTYDETVFMGYTALPEQSVLAIIEVLKVDWQPADYHLLEQNCCHFSDDLCRRLGVRTVPERILHMSRFGEACVAGEPCACIPARCFDGVETTFSPRRGDSHPVDDDVTYETAMQLQCQHLPVFNSREQGPMFEGQGAKATIMSADCYDGRNELEMQSNCVSLPPGSRERSWSLTS